MSDKIKIFVCTKGKKCPKRSGKDVCDAMREAADGKGDVEVKEAKCFKLCKKGPAVVVMPDKVKYGRVRPKDAAEIVETHSTGGKPIKRLRVKKG